jgi:hypothetical protein
MTRFEKFALAILLATRNRGNGAIVLLPFFLVVFGVFWLVGTLGQLLVKGMEGLVGAAASAQKKGNG